MISRFCLTLLFLCFHWVAYAEKNHKVHYKLTNDPIDVVIVTHPKDTPTLDYCIDGITKNCKRVRRVIVVSATKLTNKAEWFDEKKFPFSKEEVAKLIAKGNKKQVKRLLTTRGRGAGWFLQQLLKLYSPFVIPDISSNVLVVDSDTIFLNPIDFLNEKFGGLFCIQKYFEGRQIYFKHAEKLVPGYKRIYPEFYSVCHHMLFQRPILKDLFNKVERYHKQPFWMAFCSCVNPARKGASEYEIYFNYALRHTSKVDIRELLWMNSSYLENKDLYQQEGYHFVSFHSYLRNKK